MHLRPAIVDGHHKDGFLPGRAEWDGGVRLRWHVLRAVLTHLCRRATLNPWQKIELLNRIDIQNIDGSLGVMRISNM